MTGFKTAVLNNYNEMQEIIIHTTEEEEEREKGMESLLKELPDDNFQNLWKELDPQIQEADRTPKRLSPRHIELKLSKIND